MKSIWVAPLLLVLLGLGRSSLSAPIGDEHSYNDVQANYQFQWKVKDDYSGQDFGQEEARSGYNTDGEYSVVLPDGRRQIVTYKVADGESGYVADVRYEGEPHSYEPSAPKAYKSQPSYEPQTSTYKPQPSYEPQTYTTTYKPQPSYTSESSYTPKPAYKPVTYPTQKAYEQPEPAYKPRPYARRQPVAAYTTPATTTTTEAVYEAPRSYRPVSRTTYRPEPEDTYVITTTASTPYQPSYGESQVDSVKVRKPISSYKQVPEEHEHEHEHAHADEDVPVFDPERVETKKMELSNRLTASDSGSLFYGSVKGRIRAPSKEHESDN